MSERLTEYEARMLAMVEAIGQEVVSMWVSGFASREQARTHFREWAAKRATELLGQRGVTVALQRDTASEDAPATDPDVVITTPGHPLEVTCPHCSTTHKALISCRGRGREQDRHYWMFSCSQCSCQWRVYDKETTDA